MFVGAEAERERSGEMERGGCCIAMYGSGGDAEAAWKIGRIMLRFRPIAPKPTAGSAAAAAPAAAPHARARRRSKRKAGSGNPATGVRSRKCRMTEAPSPCKDDGKTSTTSSSSSTTTTISSSQIVTLPLLPETPGRKEEPAAALAEPCALPAWIGAGLVVAPRPLRPVGSWVTVECVTDKWWEGEVAWRSDQAVRAVLASDDCPGFVSDEWGRVTWANEAYRSMVLGAAEPNSSVAREEGEVRVGLVTRGLVPAETMCRAFTCRVRVRYEKRPETSKGLVTSLAAPCDVWRLDGGGAAWRLDVKAALSLGL